jgi:D-alanine-D-alanine ligase
LVSSSDDLAAAIELALTHDEVAMVEKRVVGRELECSVLETASGQLKVSVAGEIVVTGRAFYDYEAKYLGAGADLIIPAPLTQKEAKQLQQAAEVAFRALNCNGLARTDFFITAKGVVITEVNTMPGFTPISMYPALFEASGIPYNELVEELIQNGLAAGRRQS